MKEPLRFHDEHLRLSDFYDEVVVACPSCTQKALAKADFEAKKARLLCNSCGYNKELSTKIGKHGSLQMPAHAFFDAELWLQTPFRNETVYAYNYRHLAYLERYIHASLREHKNRTHFTLLEKLPKFYHAAKNRETLLKLIAKLEKK